MNNEERKIMIEVTPEEYEKIKNGKLEEPDFVPISDFNIALLISEIVRRTEKNKKQEIVQEPASGYTKIITRGVLDLEDGDSFVWESIRKENRRQW